MTVFSFNYNFTESWYSKNNYLKLFGLYFSIMIDAGRNFRMVLSSSSQSNSIGLGFSDF